MDLARSWLGQALRATGAAVVVPVAIIAALSLTALGGSGLSGLGALSQVVSGPQAAGSDVTVDNGESEIGDAVTQLAAAPSGSPGAVTPGGSTAPPRTPGGGTPPVPGPLPPNQGPGGNGPGGDNNPGGGNPGDGGPAPPTQPQPPPPEQPGAVEGVGNAVKDVTAGTPVAPTVEDAVDGLVETCNRLGCP